eukprot:103534-Pelagomonas_calceolata.AAC.3
MEQRLRAQRWTHTSCGLALKNKNLPLLSTCSLGQDRLLVPAATTFKAFWFLTFKAVAECATQIFITNDRPNVAGLIMAGSADFKTELSQSDLFDQRLQQVVIGVVDVSYGGENGFNQAIELSSDMLANVKFVQVSLPVMWTRMCSSA